MRYMIKRENIKGKFFTLVGLSIYYTWYICSSLSFFFLLVMLSGAICNILIDSPKH